MNETHLLYDQIVEMIVNSDQRTILPQPSLRFDRLIDLVSEDAEKDTEVFEIKVDQNDD